MFEIAMFPGQGSQFVSMGNDVWGLFPKEIDEADSILGYSIKELCMSDSNNVLGETQYTQPALYVVSCLSYLSRLRDRGRSYDAYIGHSLGEYSALFSAGFFDFATGLKLVKKRGELMAKMNGGTMAAVIGMDIDKVKQAISASGAVSLDIANHNTPEQIVISGLKDEMMAVQPYFEDIGARFIALNVSAAFHSRYMVEAAREFFEYLSTFSFSHSKAIVFANTTARPYQFSEIKENLSNQMYCPVRWLESINWALQEYKPRMEEVGPGKVLTNMLRSIRGV